MALTTEETRQVFNHLRVLRVSAVGSLLGGQPVLTQAVHKLQTAINDLLPDGETSVRNTLAILESLRGKLGTADTRFQAASVGSLTLNPDEWARRVEQYEFFRRELAATLAVTEVLGEHPLYGGGCREP